jgi:hypothetical protein
MRKQRARRPMNEMGHSLLRPKKPRSDYSNINIFSQT